MGILNILLIPLFIGIWYIFYRPYILLPDANNNTCLINQCQKNGVNIAYMAPVSAVCGKPKGR